MTRGGECKPIDSVCVCVGGGGGGGVEAEIGWVTENMKVEKEKATPTRLRCGEWSQETDREEVQHDPTHF